jgi:hypothetical protein
METALFGLPATTIAVVVGVPALIIILLIWWGVAFKNTGSQSQSDRGNQS